ncbi:class D sortase [Lederbergia lenta]|uniref:Sortase n=1 Tax=Lederbergia lenta TaxID=1467 RepID=A0A2X4WY42_LEDLE|nr:class D sortase [Lederbergia lenta]MCM3111906.1 class D sortase [Lederbergia lenta]MEC2323060.1 class D sortase [Lederbergia lenta]SQI62610.1 sortase [Lederbergia lenta]
MKIFGNVLIILGIIFVSLFGYQLFQHDQSEKQSLVEAKERIGEGNQSSKGENNQPSPDLFKAKHNEAFATLEIPKLEKTLPVVEGTDPDSLKKGVGHLTNSLYPGQGDQIVLSGHRDTVFRQFGKMEIGDRFIVNVPYGSYTYEIRETEIVPEDDTTVIREMGEEVLVVTTCYPFSYIGNAPDRFVAYAYPVD